MLAGERGADWDCGATPGLIQQLIICARGPPAKMTRRYAESGAARDGSCRRGGEIGWRLS